MDIITKQIEQTISKKTIDDINGVNKYTLAKDVTDTSQDDTTQDDTTQKSSKKQVENNDSVKEIKRNKVLKIDKQNGDDGGNEGNFFDIDKNINSALYSTIIVLVYIILIITILFVFINALMNYIIFCYYTIKEAIMESDEYNLSMIKLKDTYRFNLLNYVFCNSRENEKVIINNKKKDCNESSTSYYFDYIVNILAPLDNCDSESHLNIYGGNKLFNAVMKIIYLILVILLLGTISYIIISIFLGGIRRYKITGSNLFSYIYIRGAVYVFILFLVFGYCLAHSIFFKYMFIDNVYTRIYGNYIEAIKPDAYVHGELKAIENEKDFVNILSKSTLENVDIEYELNVHNKRIIDNIQSSSNNDIKASKIFIYSIYIYFKRQNANDIDIINQLNNIILQDPENKKTLIGLLLTSLNGAEITSEFNNIVSNIGKLSTTIPSSDTAEKTNPLKQNDFDEFNFNDISVYTETKLNYKVAYKIAKFYEILLNSSDNIDFGNTIYYLNMFLVLEWFMNAIFLLLSLLILYYNSDEDPFFKQIIIYTIGIIMMIIEEMKTALIGI